MFTGIITATGVIETLQPTNAGIRIGVRPDEHFNTQRLAVGDSIAVHGVCLTLVALEKSPALRLVFDVSPETLQCTVGLDQLGTRVHLERALALGEALGGHLVTGHVDGKAYVREVKAVGDCLELILSAPAALAPYLARKGSVAVNGVSLTVNEVWDEPDGACCFRINLIPHTLSCTTLAELSPGQAVNLEVDLLARYAERILGCLKGYSA